MTIDVAIVGAGMAGLTAGALCAADGMRTTVFEAHHRVGGCAGDFFLDGCRYPAGATMALGFDPAGLSGWLFGRLGLTPPLIPLDPVMRVHLPDRQVTVEASQERWRAEADRALPGSGRFWERVATLGEVAYRLVSRQPALPVERPADALQLLRCLRPDSLKLAPYLGATMADLLRQTGGGDRALRAFVDNQLLISLQAESDQCAVLPGVLGLQIYRQGAWAVKGGMGALASLLRDRIRAAGGQVRTKAAVSRLLPPAPGRPVWQVVLASGEVVAARQVVTTTTRWGLAGLLGEAAPAPLRRPRLPNDWGAFVLYLAVDEAAFGPDAGPEYHQVMMSYDQPLAEGNSVFISRFDATFAGRKGLRVLSASTHSQIGLWEGLDDGAYRELKARYEQRLLQAVQRVYPVIRAHAHRIFGGSPQTYERFTLRPGGRLGGYPATPWLSTLGAPSRRSGLPGLVLAGDTVYPGQGVGTALSGILAWREMRG